MVEYVDRVLEAPGPLDKPISEYRDVVSRFYHCASRVQKRDVPVDTGDEGAGT